MPPRYMCIRGVHSIVVKEELRSGLAGEARRLQAANLGGTQPSVKGNIVEVSVSIDLFTRPVHTLGNVIRAPGAAPALQVLGAQSGGCPLVRLRNQQQRLVDLPPSTAHPQLQYASASRSVSGQVAGGLVELVEESHLVSSGRQP